MLDFGQIKKGLERVVADFEKTAPTVSRWADDLYVRVNERPGDVRLNELVLASILATGEIGPNLAANYVYKLMHRLGQDTTGHAGF